MAADSPKIKMRTVSGDLNAGELSNIRFEAKTGAEPVPEFSLVQVTGCLAKGEDGIWRVTKASEPVRTRNPNSPSKE